MYREDPSRRLTFSEVRSRLQGDVSGLHRWVLAVLMSWFAGCWTESQLNGFMLPSGCGPSWSTINFCALDDPWRDGGGSGLSRTRGPRLPEIYA